MLDLVIAVAILVGVLVCAVVVGEVLFVRAYQQRRGHSYRPIRPGSAQEYLGRFGPHPYLPFVQLPGRQLPFKPTPDPRPFAEIKYLPQVRTNELGFVDLCNPERVASRHGDLTILCLGTSVTAGIDREDGRLVSYPLLLQERLESLRQAPVQVITAAVDGWLSSELLIYSQLRLLDLKPNWMCIYHGRNDVLAALSPNFAPDYTHYRRQMAEVLPEMRRKLWLSRLFPFIPCLTFYEYLLRRLGLRFHPLHNLTQISRPNQPDPTRHLDGLWVERRNLAYLVHAAQQSGARVLLSSYVYWPYDPTSQWQAVQAQGVQKENEMLRELAAQNGCAFVDLASEFPMDRQHLLDEMHFKAKGMRVFVEKMAEAIESFVPAGPGDAGGDITVGDKRW